MLFYSTRLQLLQDAIAYLEFRAAVLRNVCRDLAGYDDSVSVTATSVTVPRGRQSAGVSGSRQQGRDTAELAGRLARDAVMHRDGLARGPLTDEQLQANNALNADQFPEFRDERPSAALPLEFPSPPPRTTGRRARSNSVALTEQASSVDSRVDADGAADGLAVEEGADDSTSSPPRIRRRISVSDSAATPTTAAMAMQPSVETMVSPLERNRQLVQRRVASFRSRVSSEKALEAQARDTSRHRLRREAFASMKQTLVAVAGVPVPPPQDGRPLVPANSMEVEDVNAPRGEGRCTVSLFSQCEAHLLELLSRRKWRCSESSCNSTTACPPSAFDITVVRCFVASA